MTVARSLASYANEIATLAADGVAESTIGKLIAGAIADLTTTAAGAVQNTVYPVNTISVPSSFLDDKAARGLLIAGYGTTAANANAKTIIVKVNSTTLVTVAGATDNAKNYAFAIFFFKDAKDSQRGIAFLWVDTTLVAMTAIATTEDEDADLAFTVTLTNTAAAATAGSGKGMWAALLG